MSKPASALRARGSRAHAAPAALGGVSIIRVRSCTDRIRRTRPGHCFRAPAGAAALTNDTGAGFSKHRIEALTDGIYAVAMTLLVIELKLPPASTLVDQGDFLNAAAALIPKFRSWIISFYVLGIFWFSHNRQFHYLRAVDGKLVWLNLLYLSFVSLLPFSSALAGEYSRMLFSQVIYSLNMTLLAVGGGLYIRYIFRHPELWAMTVPRGFYRGALLRIAGLILVAATAVGIAIVKPRTGSAAFLLMIPISFISRRLESRAG
jgi:uncharacterized membrane protein